MRVNFLSHHISSNYGVHLNHRGSTILTGDTTQASVVVGDAFTLPIRHFTRRLGIGAGRVATRYPII